MTRIDFLACSPEFYLHQLRRWLLFALLPAIVVSVLIYAYVGQEGKTYSATAVLYVQQTQPSPSSGPAATDVQGSAQLATTYSALIASDTIARAANVRLGKVYPQYRVSYSASQITQKIAQQNTQLLSVTATDADPSRAVAAANTVAEIFVERIRRLDRRRFGRDEAAIQQQARQAQAEVAATLKKIDRYRGSAAGLSALRIELDALTASYSTLITSLNTFRATRDASGAAISLFSPAAHAGQIGPLPGRDALIAGLIVLVLASGLLYVRRYLDDRPHTPADIETAAGAPILGTVPRLCLSPAASRSRTPATFFSELGESYRLIRTNLGYSSRDRPLRSVLITSPLAAEGKSTTAGNLARAFAEVSTRVVVVDSDLRRPAQQRLFGLPEDETGGLADMLVSRHALNGGDRGMRPADLDNVFVVTAGSPATAPSNLLASNRMQTLLEHLEVDSPVTLVDSPPVLAVPDAAILSSLVDGTVLVIDPESSRRRDIRAARTAIEAAGGCIVGVVLNRLSPSGAMYYYYSDYVRQEEPRSRLRRVFARGHV